MAQHPKKDQQSSQAGFTLVELSIVLVIIGLIVGGVLVGQDMIKAAEIRATVSQLEKYNIAVNTFRAKFGGIPGDLSRADVFVDATATNGDGDGLIESTCVAGPPFACSTVFTTLDGEVSNFWNHLSLANMIDGLYDGGTTVATALPATKLGRGHISVYEMNGLHYYHIGVLTTFNTPAGALTAEEAFGIDQKMDDGTPDAGQTQAVNGYPSGGPPVDFTAPAATCATGGNYVLTGTGLTCQLQSRMN